MSMVPIIAIISDSNLASAQLVQGAQHHKGRRPDLEPERFGPAVADDIEPHLAFGGLDALVDFTLRRGDAFLDQLEMVDQAGDIGIDLFLGRQRHPGVGDT